MGLFALHYNIDSEERCLRKEIFLNFPKAWYSDGPIFKYEANLIIINSYSLAL